MSRSLHCFYRVPGGIHHIPVTPQHCTTTPQSLLKENTAHHILYDNNLYGDNGDHNCVAQPSMFPVLLQWFPVLADFQNRDTLWGFVAPAPGEMSQPITLHLGDYNLDGFPDALVILRNTSSRLVVSLCLSPSLSLSLSLSLSHMHTGTRTYSNTYRHTRKYSTHINTKMTYMRTDRYTYPDTHVLQLTCMQTRHTHTHISTLSALCDSSELFCCLFHFKRSPRIPIPLHYLG